MSLAVFLTSGSIDFSITRYSGGTRNDIGELENQMGSWGMASGVLESFVEPGYTGRYDQDNQGMSIKQRSRLYVSSSLDIKTGDIIGLEDGSFFTVGVVTSYESHQEAVLFIKV